MRVGFHYLGRYRYCMLFHCEHLLRNFVLHSMAVDYYKASSLLSCQNRNSYYTFHKLPIVPTARRLKLNTADELHKYRIFSWSYMQGITFENNFSKPCEMNQFINHNSLINRLPGHGFALHVVSSRPGPVQLTPPFNGDGLSQSLVLTFVPDSQLLLHSPYSVQSPHCPSTKNRKQTH